VSFLMTAAPRASTGPTEVRGLRPCTQPGCPTLVATGYCDQHTKERRRASDAKRPSASQRGYDAKWRRTRADYLRTHPICEDPEGCIAPATDVHHLDGLGPNGPRGHDHQNLESRCHSHHSQETAREQRGGWNA
jgi:5-methylcytosine-specific restriction protein A